MEKKQTQAPKKDEQELQERLKSDFIVRNMPAFSSLSGASYAGKPEKHRRAQISKSGDLNASATNKHRSTGLIIIGAGLIVVAGLFYGAYQFLIVPAMRSSSPVNIQEAPKQEENKVVISEVEEQSVATVTEAIVAPVTEAEIATGSETVMPDVVLPVAADSDNDGLSDVAEVFLGANPQLADTDNDSYSDKQELLSGYNPAGAGKLADNSSLALYVDADGLLAVIYPQAWTVDLANRNAVLFSAPDQSFVQISREDGEQEYGDILSWYRQQFSDAGSLDSSRFLESSFGTGIISADQQIAYFLDADKRHIVVVSYIKSGESAPYMEIFKMMASSLMRP